MELGLCQRWIGAAAQSGLLTHIAATESGSLCGPDEKLTAFMELEAAIRAYGGLCLTRW